MPVAPAFQRIDDRPQALSALGQAVLDLGRHLRIDAAPDQAVGLEVAQLAKALGLTVIATASREDTRGWVRSMRADHLVDHTKPLAAQVVALGIGAPGFVFSPTHTDRHLPDIVELVAPQGRIAPIDDPQALDVVPLKRKSLSLHWELMFTRSLFGTADMAAQGELLDRVAAEMVDAGALRTTLRERLGPIDAATLKRAHALVESGRSIGKVVLEGW